MGYGTGAIMAVPAHDTRDFEFARSLELPIRDVVYPRPIAAMVYFCDHAFPDGSVPPGWRDDLAAMLGLVATDPGMPFADALERARTRPSGEKAKFDLQGASQAVWLETIGEFSAGSPEELRRRFAEGRYCETSGEAFTGSGVCVHSTSDALSIDGLSTSDAKAATIRFLERTGLGSASVSYKLRDWLFSRQRYWGEPFPIVYDDHGRPRALPESHLPVRLPDLDNFQPESSDDPEAPPRPPLARARDWMSVTLDLGDGPKVYTRETNTMPNWAGSCWYYLRYLDPENAQAFVSPAADAYWMAGSAPRTPPGTPGVPGRLGGVDLYVGGVEHAVLHLLYARFWHKILYDLGHLSTPEPFQRLFNQGYIQAAAYTDQRGVYVEASEVEERDGHFYHQGRPVTREYGKMGKSLKNAVAPDDICREYGCDTLRLYEMSMGPLDASKPWNTRDIVGGFRFLQRVWRNLIDEKTGESRVSDDACDQGTLRHLHKTLIGVRRDMETLGLNTAISKLIEFNNHLATLPAVPMEAARALILLLAPLTPHVAEELFHRVVRRGEGERRSIAYETIPDGDPTLAADDTIEIPVQVNGKVRTRLNVPVGAGADAIEQAALADERVLECIAGKAVRKVIVVPGRMVNLVVG
ncbi:MAG: class I tRNA ligase family protein [Phycisphaerae bacterium]|nr:class I tRNA ligase family protein [Phycisphaerae bacterium]